MPEKCDPAAAGGANLPLTYTIDDVDRNIRVDVNNCEL